MPLKFFNFSRILPYAITQFSIVRCILLLLIQKLLMAGIMWRAKYFSVIHAPARCIFGVDKQTIDWDSF